MTQKNKCDTKYCTTIFIEIPTYKVNVENLGPGS